MERRIITDNDIERYRDYLFAEEKSRATIEKYIRCHPSNYKLPLPSECLGLDVGANIVPFTVIGSFPSKTWNLKGARHI